MTKTCFKCGETQPLDEFYPHPRMADGRLNKCKRCARRDVRTNYQARAEQYSAYERARYQTKERRQSVSEQQRRYRAANPIKVAARQKVQRALRRGLISRQPCRVCGAARAEAHHPDYTRPLHVEWLCFEHHAEAHGRRVRT